MRKAVTSDQRYFAYCSGRSGMEKGGQLAVAPQHCAE